MTTTSFTWRGLVRTSLLAGVAFGVGMFAFSMGPLFRLDLSGGPSIDERALPPASVIVARAVVWGAAGLVFGGLLGLFVALLSRRATRDAPPMTEPGERLLHHGPANLWRGWVSIGGWLYLTTHGLRFRPHRFNAGLGEEWATSLAAVLEVEPVRSAGLVPNALRLTLSDGTRVQLVVSERAAWLEALAAARGGSR